MLAGSWRAALLLALPTFHPAVHLEPSTGELQPQIML